MRGRCPLWGPWRAVLAWMLLIFLASTQIGGSDNTSRLLEPALRFFWPEASSQFIKDARFLIRKAAHVAEYAVLAALIWRALQSAPFPRLQSNARRRALTAAGLAVVYALTDEFHQRFVPGRTGSLRDVGLDALGAIAGVSMAWLRTVVRRKSPP